MGTNNSNISNISNNSNNSNNSNTNSSVINMDYVYIRNVLDEGKFELTSAYERGLFNVINVSRFYEAFRRISDKFAETGLDFGAEKFKELYEIMSASRFEAKWQADDAVLKIAEIWQYIGACEDRLNFYEILDGINEGADT